MAKIRSEDLFDKSLETTIKSLVEAEKMLIKTTKELAASAKQLKKAFGESGIKNLTDLQKRYQEQVKISNTVEKNAIEIQKRKEALEQARQRTLQAATRTEIQARKEAERMAKQAAKNAREAAKLNSSYSRLSKSLTDARNKAKNLGATYGTTSKQFQAARKDVLRLDNQLKKIDSNLGQNQRNVGNYASAWGGVKNAIIGATGFVGGVAIANQALRKIGQELTKNSKIQNSLRQQYKLTNDELDEVAEKVQIVSNVYEKDYNEVIQSANALSKEFGISADESLNIINEGFEKGADNSGEFLSMLREYPAQLRSVGLNADQSISIMTQAVREGVFSDKGVDAIKEAGIRLRELTPATRAALDNIGLASDEIEQSLRDGTKSMFEVIQEVSRELGKLPEQSTEVGTALADIFGGPGEDAGIRYIKMLGDVSMSLDDVKSNTDPYIESQRRLTEEWTKTVLQMQEGNGVLTTFNNLLANSLSILNTQAQSLEGDNFFKTIGNYLKTLVVTGIGIATGRTQEFIAAIEELNKELEIDADVLEEVNEEYLKVNRSLNQGAESIRTENDVTKDLIEIQEQLLKQAREMPGTTEREIAVRNRKVIAIENEISRLKELGEIQQTEAFNISDTLESYKSSFEELEEIENDYLEGYLEREERKTEIAREQEERRKELRKENEEALFDLGTELGNALFERRIEQYNQDLEANSAYYDKLLANQELSEEQRALLEAQRLEKENEIRARQRQAERQQFLFNQGVAIAEIAIETAKNVAANPLFAPFYISLGAIQTGIVLAQSIPQFAKGTDDAPEGPAIVGEKGTELVMSKDKKTAWLTDNKPQLTNLNKGDKVIPHNQLLDSINNYTNSQIVNNSDKITGNDEKIGWLVSQMLDKSDKNTKSMIKELRQLKPKQSRQTTIDRMRTDELKSKLRN